MPSDTQQSLENLRLERDAILLYDALAGIEKDPSRAAAFRRIAANERRHADVWARKLAERGATCRRPRAGRGPGSRSSCSSPGCSGPGPCRTWSPRSRATRRTSTTGQSSPEVAAIAADEREHAEIWQRLKADDANGGLSAEALAARRGASGATADIASRERWHRSGRSGTLRAVIFGVSDGLVSNLSLVMGVAGAAGDAGQFVLLGGVAGLLAGAFSMAAGEYISMQSQRELFERQIDLERAELEAMPEEEEAELAALSTARRASPPARRRRSPRRIFEDKDRALDTLVREELGLDPDELGSPVGAATGSFVAFAVGAAVPVVPYALSSGAGCLHRGDRV